MSRREVQSIKIDIAEKCYAHCADVLLMYNVRKTKNVLAPIEIGIDEVVVAIARSAGDFVEIGEVMGMNLLRTPNWIKHKLTADDDQQHRERGN